MIYFGSDTEHIKLMSAVGLYFLEKLRLRVVVI